MNLAKSDTGMSASEIAIQLQRMFAFGDALCRALGEHLDESQPQVATRMVWDRRQGFCQLCFGRRERRFAIGHKIVCALERVRRRRTNQRLDIAGISGERAIEKVANLRDIVWGQTLIEPSQALKIQV